MPGILNKTEAKQHHNLYINEDRHLVLFIYFF